MAKRQDTPVLEIEPGVLDSVEAHAYSNLSAEVGGMLVGSISNGVTRIVGHVPATAAAAEQISLTFTHDVWAEILEVVNRDFSDSTIVGWYHTHPSFGLFLSQYDEFIQRNFFAQPGQVALVIDPIEGSLAWFVESGEEIKKFDESSTRRGAIRRPEDSTSSIPRGVSRGRVAIVVAAAALFAGTVGWGIANLASPPDTRVALIEKNDQYAQLQASFAELSQRFATIQAAPVLAVTVQDGDTMSSITQHWYGEDQSALVLAANSLQSSNDLKVGDVLLLPGIPGVRVADKLVAELPAVTPTPTGSPTPTPNSTATPSPSSSGM